MEPQQMTREQEYIQQLNMRLREAQTRMLERGQMLASLASQVTNLEQQLTQMGELLNKFEGENRMLREHLSAPKQPVSAPVEG